MRKIIMVSMLILTVLFTGCGKSKEEKKIEMQIEQEDKQDLKEAEALMTLRGADEEEIEEELEYIKEEQKETKNERIEAEQEYQQKLREEEQRIKYEQELAEKRRKAEQEELEAEIKAQKEKEEALRKAEEERKRLEQEAIQKRKDFIENIVKQQTNGLSYTIEYNGSHIKVKITDNDQNLINSVSADIEDVRYTQIKQNIALWSGELNDKIAKELYEQTVVRYYYNAGSEWLGTAENGFMLSDYLMY